MPKTLCECTKSLSENRRVAWEDEKKHHKRNQCQEHDRGKSLMNSGRKSNRSSRQRPRVQKEDAHASGIDERSKPSCRCCERAFSGMRYRANWEPVRRFQGPRHSSVQLNKNGTWRIQDCSYLAILAFRTECLHLRTLEFLFDIGYH